MKSCEQGNGLKLMNFCENYGRKDMRKKSMQRERNFL